MILENLKAAGVQQAHKEDRITFTSLKGWPGNWIAAEGTFKGLKRLARAARAGAIQGGSIEDGKLKVDRLTAAVPAEAGDLVIDLYRRLPDVRITDLLMEVDKATGFTDAFPHLWTGAPCRDRIGLLNVLLAEGLNLGLSKMAEASNTHDFFQLSRLSRRHIEGEAVRRVDPTIHQVRVEA